MRMEKADSLKAPGVRSETSTKHGQFREYVVYNTVRS